MQENGKPLQEQFLSAIKKNPKIPSQILDEQVIYF